MTEKIYLETLRSVLGRSISQYLNITKFLRAAFFIERLRWLFLSNHPEHEEHSKSTKFRRNFYNSHILSVLSNSCNSIKRTYIWIKKV